MEKHTYYQTLKMDPIWSFSVQKLTFVKKNYKCQKKKIPVCIYYRTGKYFYLYLFSYKLSYTFFSFILNFSVRTKSWKNHLKKMLTNDSLVFLFSAALTSQNSPELHFRFMNSFIQPSSVESLSKSLKMISPYCDI